MNSRKRMILRALLQAKSECIVVFVVRDIDLAFPYLVHSLIYRDYKTLCKIFGKEIDIHVDQGSVFQRMVP